MDKPTGNVTFLFTDIEGSTRLAQEFPESLPAAIEKHHSIMRKAIESNNGFVFETVGDSFCCSFEKAEDAVKAAIQIQINLSNEVCELSGQKGKNCLIRVRIGIHSGNAEWNGNSYMGYITLARTARVMSAAYGEQILISNDAYELCFPKLPARSAGGGFGKEEGESNISFRDLGERRLKDVIEPIRLFQVASKELREEFPPLKTLDARPNNLPVQLSGFIGRADEIKHAKELLKDNRLLTLTGTGGLGKTRFSLQVAADLIDDFANGVWFVELAAVSDPVFLAITIINDLGLKEEQKKTPEETLADHLKDKEILIVLDNCEQIIESCAKLAENLLLKCPKLKVIATSREGLNCIGEQTYRIPPLTLPDPNHKYTPEQLTQYESVRLFIERALAVNPKFRVTNENAPALVGVCSRLDGVPLALELAAARTKVLSVEKIFERLDDRFNLLTGGKRTALPRQQTLRALIDWSYDLLSENEKILWSRLSVFSGGWTLEAAEKVCSDETISKNDILELLSQLTEKSVIIYDETKDRYRILESLKQYGIEKLSDGKEIFLQHLNYFLELSKKAKPELLGEKTKFWMHKIEADNSNFISAIEWSVRNENSEKGILTAAALGRFWNITGQYSTGIRLIEIILESAGTLDKSSSKVNVLNWIGSFKSSQGDSEQAKKYFEESLDIRKKIGDKYGIAESINKLGSFTFNQGDYEQSKKYYEESLCIFKGIGSKNGIANSLNYLGNVAYGLGDFGQAKKYYEDSLAIYKDIVDKNGIAHSINNLGNAAFGLGDFGKAIKLLSSAEKLLESMGVVLNKNDQKIKDENIAKIREQLSKEEFANYREEGENLTLDEAYKLAVKQFGS